mmetsp:Transcript_133171/g.230904  ORF Transcript_133171/g.230904 Transcript_133171/m.230904 type:complete len:134 (+) Transcript_133171:494-895(+)
MPIFSVALWSVWFWCSPSVTKACDVSRPCFLSWRNARPDPAGVGRKCVGEGATPTPLRPDIHSPTTLLNPQLVPFGNHNHCDRGVGAGSPGSHHGAYPLPTTFLLITRATIFYPSGACLSSVLGDGIWNCPSL